MLIKSEKSSFETYLVDAANIMGDCEQVYFPESSKDVISILKEANKTNRQVTVSGARTGLNGGGVPQNGILISTDKLDKLLHIDTNSMHALAEPGLTLKSLQNELDKYGLFYPPDPTETNCSIGGTVANNASGARTFKYGPTRNFIEAIKVVLADGSDVEIQRGVTLAKGLEFHFKLKNSKEMNFHIPDYKLPKVKHSAGYFCKPDMDLIDLFIGSEGTLGIITEIKLKLLKKSENVLSMIIFFEKEKDLFSFIYEIRDKSLSDGDILNLREIEFFDKNTLRYLSEEYTNIPDKSQGAVWIEQEIDDEDENLLLNEISEIINKHNGNVEDLWYAIDEREREKLKEFRHKIALIVNDIISSRGLVKVGTDTSVPEEKFSEFFSFTKSLIEKNMIDYVVYGHIGNSHLHFNMLPGSEHELNLCRKLYGEICKKSIDLNGTISAEHGIGKLKTKYLLEMFGEQNIIEMAKLKKTFDPRLILNIGNIFDAKFLRMV